MNWKIAMLEIAELGLFLLALWIPFRMGRAGSELFGAFWPVGLHRLD
jgi:hypothetical protein